MWKVTAEYRQGREVKDDKNRKKERERVAWKNDLTGLPFQIYSEAPTFI
jgi:hypothetical protein